MLINHEVIKTKLVVFVFCLNLKNDKVKIMKKLHAILFVIMLTFSTNAQLIITEIADPDNIDKARFIELTNIGQDSFDLTGYNLIRWTNGNSTPSSGSEKDLSSYGPVAAGDVLTFANNATEFQSVYGFAPTASFGTGGVADSNGDDQIALRNGTTIYDIFGVPGEDGSGTAHEFEDGRAERKSTVTAPNPTWNASEWNIDNDSGGGDGAQDAPGGFDPGEWIGLSVGNDPVVTVGSDVSGLDYFEGYGPSSESSFSVDGINLTQDITVTVSTNFEISLTSGSGFTNSLNVLSDQSGTASATIYVRLASGLTPDTYTGNASVTTTGAGSQTVSLTGTVTAADPQITVTAYLDVLNYVISQGGPSAEDSFSVEGLFLSEDISVTAPVDFEVSLTSGQDFSGSVTISTPQDGTVASTTVYVRLAAGLSAGNYTGNITVSSTGVTDELIAIEGNAYGLPTNSLVITGAYDGPLTGGTPKGIELYVLQDIQDLSLYGISSVSNGGGTSAGNVQYNFPADVVNAGTFIYLATEDTKFQEFFGFASTYQNSVVSINGDDSIELYENGQIIDTFGDVDTDATGEAWEYLDGWAYRTSGTGPEGTTFTPTNWVYSGANALVGESTNAEATSPFPAGTFAETASVIKFNNTEIYVYPNPVKADLNFIGLKGTVHASVYDVTGRLFLQKEVNSSLDVSSLKAGIYIVKIENESGLNIFNIIKD
jgi:hypothetical protein